MPNRGSDGQRSTTPRTLQGLRKVPQQGEAFRAKRCFTSATMPSHACRAWEKSSLVARSKAKSANGVHRLAAYGLYHGGEGDNEAMLPNAVDQLRLRERKESADNRSDFVCKGASANGALCLWRPFSLKTS